MQVGSVPEQLTLQHLLIDAIVHVLYALGLTLPRGDDLLKEFYVLQNELVFDVKCVHVVERGFLFFHLI